MKPVLVDCNSFIHAGNRNHQLLYIPAQLRVQESAYALPQTLSVTLITPVTMVQQIVLSFAYSYIN